MINRPRFYQRQFFIKKDFQAKFILLYLLAVLTIVGLSSWFLYAQIKTAVERHLYSTHMKVDQVGDFLDSLLFSANFTSVVAIVVTVLILSLLVFRRINKKFSRLDAAIISMSQGDFASASTGGRRFFAAGELAELIEHTRLECQIRYNALENVLNELEQAAANNALEQWSAAKLQLDDLLAEIRIK